MISSTYDLQAYFDKIGRLCLIPMKMYHFGWIKVAATPSQCHCSNWYWPFGPLKLGVIVTAFAHCSNDKVSRYLTTEAPKNNDNKGVLTNCFLKNGQIQICILEIRPSIDIWFCPRSPFRIDKSSSDKENHLNILIANYTTIFILWYSNTIKLGARKD